VIRRLTHIELDEFYHGERTEAPQDDAILASEGVGFNPDIIISDDSLITGTSNFYVFLFRVNIRSLQCQLQTYFC
jgi:hypothetical protein